VYEFFFLQIQGGEASSSLVFFTLKTIPIGLACIDGRERHAVIAGQMYNCGNKTETWVSALANIYTPAGCVWC